MQHGGVVVHDGAVGADGVPIGSAQRVAVVGTPEYFATHGTPEFPKDLLAHECIRQRIGRQGRFFEGRFRAGAKVLALELRGKLIYGDMRSTSDAAALGLGVAYVYRQFADSHLRRGDLVAVLEKYCGAREPFYLYFANRAQMPGKLRLHRLHPGDEPEYPRRRGRSLITGRASGPLAERSTRAGEPPGLGRNL